MKLRHHSVISWFSAQAHETPHAIALTQGGETLSYADLFRKAGEVAARLQAMDIQSGQVLGLILRDPSRRIVAMLGGMLAGCIVAPFDPGEPTPRLVSMVEQIHPSAWISEDACKMGLSGLFGLEQPALAAPILVIDVEDEARQADAAAIDIDSNAPCYIFFTSGSTGKPKPILGRSASLAHFIQWEIETFGIDKACRGSHFCSPVFDASLRDIFVPLCSGGTVCIPPPLDQGFEPQDIVHWLHEESITLVHCVPSFFRALMRAELEPHFFPTLKHVLLAGEPLHPSDIRNWHGKFGDRIEMVNLYGATETTMIKYFHRINPSELNDEYIPVGKPISGARGIVLSEDGQICSAGEVGELFIRSPYFTLGYYKQAGLTSEVFIPNPLNNNPEDIVYRTGDLATQLPDGNLRLMGRKDFQLKVHGMRVEPGEIENALLSLPGVKAAVVVGGTDPGNGVRLHAYVVMEDPDVEMEDLRMVLNRKIPMGLLPSVIEKLESLPLTPTGKADRRALMSRAGQPSAGSHRQLIPPRTETERTLARIYAEVLAVPQVGRKEDFFALGGHSLKALMAIARIRQEFDLNLTLKSFFENSTVAQLGDCVDALLLVNSKESDAKSLDDDAYEQVEI